MKKVILIVSLVGLFAAILLTGCATNSTFGNGKIELDPQSAVSNVTLQAESIFNTLKAGKVQAGTACDLAQRIRSGTDYAILLAPQYAGAKANVDAWLDRICNAVAQANEFAPPAPPAFKAVPRYFIIDITGESREVSANNPAIQEVWTYLPLPTPEPVTRNISLTGLKPVSLPSTPTTNAPATSNPLEGLPQ